MLLLYVLIRKPIIVQVDRQ